MNISKNIPKENGRKKMTGSLLGKIEGRGIGISAKTLQIKTTAKKSFLFFCSSLMIATGILCPVAIDVSAEAVGPLPEGFNDIDLSDILVTFPTGAGASISNETVLNDLYSHYGVSGWGVSDMTPYFDITVKATGESAGFSNSVLNEHLGDNQWFEQNGYDVKVNYDQFKQKLDSTESLTQYGANYIHQATLSPSTGNPWEWDWSSILEDYFKTGLIGFEHFFIDFDTLNNIAVTMDDVLRNVYEFWTPNINSSTGIDKEIDDQYILGGQFYEFKWLPPTGNNYNYENIYCSPSIEAVYCMESKEVYAHNYADSNSLLNRKSLSNTSPPAVFNLNPGQTRVIESLSSRTRNVTFSGITLATVNDVNAYFANNSYQYTPMSPDLINPEIGNITPEDLQILSPSIEQGQAIRPIPQEAYENWAQTNNLQEPAQNGALLGALVTPYIENVPAPAPSPAPDDPWADPVPDTEPANRPVSPDQPDFPEEPELTDEQINESLQGATPDLTEIFPFCIPWDIARILKHFTASRKAPYIEWTFESDLFGFSYTFEIDMAIFDDVATILRLLELAGFILGLAILTRYLIGAN